MTAPAPAPVGVRVVLPSHLRALAGISGEVLLDPPPASAAELVDDLEQRWPALRGTVRDPATGRRRPFVRFFACEQDLSHQPLDEPLPGAVLAGREPFLVVGAMAGG